MFCMQCGAELAESMAFCPKCGAKLAQEGNSKYVQGIAKPEGIDKEKKKPVVKYIVAALLIVIGVLVLLFVALKIGSGSRRSGFDDESGTDDYDRNPNGRFSLTQTYLNEDEGFSFMYPDDWEIENDEEIASDFLVSVAHTSVFGPYAWIAVGKEVDDGSGVYFTATSEDFEELLSGVEGVNNLEIMELSNMTLDGNPARKLIYAANNDIGTRAIVIQYFYVRDFYVYAVTCSVEKDRYDSYEPVFNDIMDSYSIYEGNTWGGDDEVPFGYEGDEDDEGVPFPDIGYGLSWVEAPYTSTDWIGSSINGVIENNSGSTKGWVTIHFNLYDTNGYLIGTASDSISDLRNGDKWKFSASILENTVAYWEFIDVSVY